MRSRFLILASRRVDASSCPPPPAPSESRSLSVNVHMILAQGKVLYDVVPSDMASDVVVQLRGA